MSFSLAVGLGELSVLYL